MPEDRILYHTWSLCPVCLDRLPASRILRGREVFLKKSCKAHGTFETLIWRGYSDFLSWTGTITGQQDFNPNCPDDCGLCPDHLQQTCCVILNITDRCNMDCVFCFADPAITNADPTPEEITRSLYRLIDKGKTLVQLSGGEPALRDDLPEIVKTARQAGAKYVQLNTNGVRLAEDQRFVRELADAGLSFVFMQYDGTRDEIHRRIRNRPLQEIKQKAIDHCAKYNIGVTLVPTLVKGINTENIGEILAFATANSPKVRGVHFQPAAYLGRTPGIPSNDERFTLDELVREIEIQTGGMISAAHLLPSCCDHPLCGFHGDFVVHHNKLVPLLKKNQSDTACCCNPQAAGKNREFIGRRWLRPGSADENKDYEARDLHDMEFFLDRVRSHGFTLTAMAFQDAGNIDLARLRQCSLHVYDEGRMVPFCAYYLTPWSKI